MVATVARVGEVIPFLDMATGDVGSVGLVVVMLVGAGMSVDRTIATIAWMIAVVGVGGDDPKTEGATQTEVGVGVIVLALNGFEHGVVMAEVGAVAEAGAEAGVEAGPVAAAGVEAGPVVVAVAAAPAPTATSTEVRGDVKVVLTKWSPLRQNSSLLPTLGCLSCHQARKRLQHCQEQSFQVSHPLLRFQS